jgi:hypothetical protein
VPKYSYFPHFTVWRFDCGLTPIKEMRAKAGEDIRQSELIAESARMAPLDYSEFVLRFGSGAYGPATANRKWVSRNFFFSPTFSQ